MKVLGGRRGTRKPRIVIGQVAVRDNAFAASYVVMPARRSFLIRRSCWVPCCRSMRPLACGELAGMI
jgi:hypothetical protein